MTNKCHVEGTVHPPDSQFTLTVQKKKFMISKATMRNPFWDLAYLEKITILHNKLAIAHKISNQPVALY
jgi:hypothetical protein